MYPDNIKEIRQRGNPPQGIQAICLQGIKVEPRNVNELSTFYPRKLLLVAAIPPQRTAASQIKQENHAAVVEDWRFPDPVGHKH